MNTDQRSLDIPKDEAVEAPCDVSLSVHNQTLQMHFQSKAEYYQGMKMTRTASGH